MCAQWLFLCAILAGCGGDGSSPRFTSKQAMLEVDFADKELARALGDPPRALQAARTILEWVDYPAVSAYPGRPGFQGEAAGFEESRQDFLLKLRGVIEAAESGEVGALGRRYGPMRLSCEICHARYRPELPGALSAGAGDGR